MEGVTINQYSTHKTNPTEQTGVIVAGTYVDRNPLKHRSKWLRPLAGELRPLQINSLFLIPPSPKTDAGGRLEMVV